MTLHQHTVEDTAGVIAPPPLIFAGGLGLGLLLHRLRPWSVLPHSVARRLGPLLLGCAGLLMGSAFLTMRRAHTDVRPHVPTTALVSSGPYRYTRNPIYLAFTLAYTGLAALAGSAWPMVLLPGVLQVIRRGVIAREERYLARRFGQPYISYMAQVRRWF